MNEFELSRSFRRIETVNSDVISTVFPAQPSTEQFSLFRQYLDHRHQNGGMSDMSALDYAIMVEDSHVQTRVIEYRLRTPGDGISAQPRGELIAVALSDLMSDGLSMVYSFYDPNMVELSLGTFAILDHIAIAREAGLPYVYLGYWVEGSDRMQYKIRYRPIELLGREGWQRLSSERHDSLIAAATLAQRGPRDAASPAKDASLPQFALDE